MPLRHHGKYFRLLLILPLIISQAALGSSLGTYTQYRDNAVTNPGQLWAIKLCGVIILRDHGRQNYLAPDARTSENQSNVRAILVRYWNVNNRLDLLNEIQSLRTHGLVPEFMKLVQVVEKGLSSGMSIKAILSKNRGLLSPTAYNYLIYISKNIDKFKGKDLILWDEGRIISLARWGYEVGYLSEEEAWNIIMPIAAQLRARYTSWKEYGELYSLTRAAWAAGFGEGDRYYVETCDLVRQLLAPDGAWTTSPWSSSPLLLWTRIINHETNMHTKLIERTHAAA